MEETNIIDVVNLREDVDIECKEAHGGVPKDLWETYSSFANTNGGTIYLGMKENKGKFNISGVDPAKRLKEFWDTINNTQKISINLLNDTNITTIEIDGKTIIKIEIPRADRRQKPVYINGNPYRGTYRRNYEGDYKCNEEEVKRMIADQGELSQDGIVLENYGLDDINKESLSSYRHRLASNKPHHTLLGLDDKTFLYKIGGWGRYRETGKEGLTAAGLLMFGEERSIIDFFPKYFLDYREKLDINTRWTNRIISSDGTWSGNLYDFYFKVITKLTDNMNIPFKLEGNIRKDDTLVHEALREALANTLIHADYNIAQGTVVEKGVTYFEFSNPGSLRISVEEALNGGISDPRNANIFKMFNLIGIGERSGFGLDKIQAAWKEQHWRSPYLVERLGTDRTKLILRTISLLPDESITILKNALREKYDLLDSCDIMALVTAHQEECVSNSRLQILLDRNSLHVNKVLTSLVDKEYLLAEGRGRGTRYYLADIFIENNENHIKEIISLPDNGDSLPDNGENLPDSGDSLPYNGESLPDNNDSLLEISKLVREKKRVNPQIMKKIILEMCENEFLTIKELVKYLRRSERTLREEYVKELVEKKKLALKYPNNLNHPNQAYKTIDLNL